MEVEGCVPGRKLLTCHGTLHLLSSHPETDVLNNPGGQMGSRPLHGKLAKRTVGKDGGGSLWEVWGCKVLEEVCWSILVSFELFVCLSCPCPVPSCRKEGGLLADVVRNLQSRRRQFPGKMRNSSSCWPCETRMWLNSWATLGTVPL